MDEATGVFQVAKDEAEFIIISLKEDLNKLNEKIEISISI